jgi:hypothetical protein
MAAHPAFEERDAAAKARHEQGKRLQVRRAVGVVGVGDFVIEQLATQRYPWWELPLFVVASLTMALLCLAWVLLVLFGVPAGFNHSVFVVVWFLLSVASGLVLMIGLFRWWCRVRIVRPYAACTVSFLPAVLPDARLNQQLNTWADVRPDKQRSGNWTYDPTYIRVRVTWKYVEGCEAEFAPVLTAVQRAGLIRVWEAELGRCSYSRTVEMWCDSTLYSQYLAGDVLKQTWELTSAALDVAVASTYSSNVPFILSGCSETDIISNTKCVARLALFLRHLDRQALEVQASLGRH